MRLFKLNPKEYLDQRVICATNKKPLRKKCADHGIEILWDLEIMLQLCMNGKLKIDVAEKTAEQIVTINRRIAGKVLKEVIAKLKSI